MDNRAEGLQPPDLLLLRSGKPQTKDAASVWGYFMPGGQEPVKPGQNIGTQWHAMTRMGRQRTSIVVGVVISTVTISGCG